ncbi:hypothetical protein DSECCO2_410400 [anaerobic digester metagenome]
MYKYFYVVRMWVNVLLIGALNFFIFFDDVDYAVYSLAAIVVTQILFALTKKYKFPQEHEEKNNKVLQILMILSLWAGLYVNRLFLLGAWIIYVVIEAIMYVAVKEYFY